MDRGHPGQVFGDMVNTFPARIAPGEVHALATESRHGYQARVHITGQPAGCKPARAVPAFRHQSDHRLRCAEAPCRTGNCGTSAALATPTHQPDAHRIRVGGGGAGGAPDQPQLGRAQDRPAPARHGLVRRARAQHRHRHPASPRPDQRGRPVKLPSTGTASSTTRPTRCGRSTSRATSMPRRHAASR